MIPILYESTETEFSSNGLGRLRDCIECKVTEERNGIYEVEFQYPVDGANYDKIHLGRIIAVEHDYTNDVQPFDIVSCSKPINGVVTFRAVHISYRQGSIVARGSSISSLSSAFTMLRSGVPSNPFTYETDITSTAYMASADGLPHTVRSMLGGMEGSILDTYGGEYEWDKFRVILHASRGRARNLTIRYGVNLVDYTEETDYSEAYNAVVPFWSGEDTAVIGDMISVNTATYNGRTDCVPLDLTDKFETQPTKAQVESMATSLLNSKQPYLAHQNITVNFIRLQDTDEYAQYASLFDCALCDTVRVVFPRYGMDGRFKIVKTVYNVLTERWDEIELGQLQTTLAEALGISETTKGNSIVTDAATFASTTSQALATTDINKALALSEESSNANYGVTNNGGIQIKNTGKYIVSAFWAYNTLGTSANSITGSVRVWRNNAMSILSNVGETHTGAYYAQALTGRLFSLNAGDVLFLSARNNTSAVGNFASGYITVQRVE